MPVGTGGGVNSVEESGRKSFARINRQDCGPSNSTIDIYDLTDKKGTVNSLAPPLTETHSQE